MILNAAFRLVAANKDSLWMHTVLSYLRSNNIDAAFTDDDKDTIIAKSDMADVVDTLDAHRWTVADKRVIDGGLYTSGVAVIMHGGEYPLKLMQIAHNRIFVCKP